MPHDPEVVETLNSGEIEIVGRMPNSSNATFFVVVGGEESGVHGIYKPLAGERPLWDFPEGLYKREIAAYELSEALGYHIVPPTVYRDGPAGEGSLQLFVEYDHTEHYFHLLEQRPDTHSQLRTMTVFDVVANNTDRKGGHVLLDADGHVWGIDHGVCFSADFKLRTVMWDFAGEDIADELLAPLEVLMEDLPAVFHQLLSDEEIEAMFERTEWLLQNRVFPSPGSRYDYPWPIL